MSLRRVVGRALTRFDLLPEPASPEPDWVLAREAVLRTLPVGRAGAEIGVDRGDFSAQLLHTARPSVLHLIDPWQYETETTYSQSLYGGAGGGDQASMDERHATVCKRFSDEQARGQVVIHRATSEGAAAEIDDGSLDWVYIDGNHLYDYVLADLSIYATKVRVGGLIAGDDYGEGGWWEGGVKRAVDAFLRNGPVSPEWIKDGQFVLRREGG